MSDRVNLAKYINSRIDEGVKTDKLVKDIAQYLLTNRKLADLNSLMRDATNLRVNQGIIEANAVSKYPLSTNAISHIKAVIKKSHPKAKKITINSSIDESLTGGVKVYFDDVRLDLSLDNKLNKFRELAVN